MRPMVTVLAALAVGCGEGTTTHEELGASCTALAEGCHEAGDMGDADAEACHDVGHAGDEAACEAELTACLDLCAALMETMTEM